MSGPVVLVLRLLLAVSLYVFLGWAFWSLWQEIRQQGLLLTARKTPAMGLTISEGGKLYHHQFSSAEITIGRNPACDCVIDNESISARHARLSYHHNQWWLEDLRSTNGTLMNDAQVAMPMVVVSGDEFTCGQVRLRIDLAGDLHEPRKAG
jgi:hypothetical protein